MSQYQDFGFQSPSRLEAVAQHTDEEEGTCYHQPQSCSDSVAAVTPVDGVFGSDSAPFSKLVAGKQNIGGHRVQVREDYRRDCMKAINQLVGKL